MPIFFMLPFIILQGMLDVVLDNIRERPKGTLLSNKSFLPVKTGDRDDIR